MYKAKTNGTAAHMKTKLTYIIAILLFATAISHAQTKNKMQVQNNPLMCDPDSGICEVPANAKHQPGNSAITPAIKPVKIIYYTDPICSSCWGIEPQLRKLKMEYGNDIEIEYRMGGLLPDWNYNTGGISKPSDVAHHWDEVSLYYYMPIDGDVWLQDPLPSSYPPSIAFKAAQMQDHEKAILFLREIREMVFLQKKNITKWEHLEAAAKKVQLDIPIFKADYNNKAQQLFNEDLKLGKELGVRGFPTMFFADTSGHKEMVYGSKPYSVFENALLKMHPSAVKKNYEKDWFSVFSKYHSLTAKEFAELTLTPRSESEKHLDELVAKGKVNKLTTKNGSIWTIKD